MCVCPLGCLDGGGYPGGQDVLNVRKFGSFDRKLTPRETGSYVCGQSKIDLGEISNGNGSVFIVFQTLDHSTVFITAVSHSDTYL